MEIRIRETGDVISEANFRLQHGNVSFPPVLTEEILNDFEADPIFEGVQPSANIYQVVERSGIEQIGEKWFKKYIVLDVSDEQKAQIDQSQAASIRAMRDQDLKNTDWTQLADATVDKAAWAAYRQALRDIPQQAEFPYNVTYPVTP